MKVKIIETGIPQYEIANKAEMRQGRLSAIISGFEKPRGFEVEKLAEVLNCNVSDIFPVMTGKK